MYEGYIADDLNKFIMIIHCKDMMRVLKKLEIIGEQDWLDLRKDAGISY